MTLLMKWENGNHDREDGKEEVVDHRLFQTYQFQENVHREVKDQKINSLPMYCGPLGSLCGHPGHTFLNRKTAALGH